MQIRRLEADQIDLLLAVPAGLFDAAFRPDQARAFLANPLNDLLLAYDGDLAVGMASATVLHHPDKLPTLFVLELGTRDSHLRQGIASALMAALRARARDRGCATIWLATEPDNAPALGLYRKLGGAEEPVVGFEWTL